MATIKVFFVTNHYLMPIKQLLVKGCSQRQMGLTGIINRKRGRIYYCVIVAIGLSNALVFIVFQMWWDAYHPTMLRVASRVTTMAMVRAAAICHPGKITRKYISTSAVYHPGIIWLVLKACRKPVSSAPPQFRTAFSQRRVRRHQKS